MLLKEQIDKVGRHTLEEFCEARDIDILEVAAVADLYTEQVMRRMANSDTPSECIVSGIIVGIEIGFEAAAKRYGNIRPQ